MNNGFAISSLVTAGLSFLLALFVYYKKRNKLNRIWALVSLSTSFWALGLGGVVLSKTQSLAIFFQYVLDFAAIFIPIFFLHFTVVLVKKITVYKKLLICGYFTAALMSIFSFTSLFKLGVGHNQNFSYWVEPGRLYILFPIYYVTLAVIAVLILFINYRVSRGIQKQQLLYIILVAFVGYLGGATNFLPQFSRVYPFGNYLVVFYIFATAYAIAKHRLFDIKFAILRTITYSILVLVISAFVVAISLYIPSLAVSSFYRTAAAVLVSVLIVLIITPLKSFLGRVTDKLFFKGSIDYSQFQKELTEIVNREIDSKKLVITVDDKLVKGLKIQKARILLPKSGSGGYETLLRNPDSLELKSQSRLAEYLSESKRIVVLESLERKIEDTQDEEERKKLEQSKAELERLEAAVAAPILTDEKLAAILVLGIKKSGDIYSQDDLNLLEVLGPQLASAIEKSKLYDQIRRFNLKLQKEIAIATEGLRKANEDLQDRNRFLTSIQAVTQLITRSLDFKTVTQAIVDSISTQMGFIAGILLFYGEDKYRLFPEAITRVHYTKQVEKLLPKPISEYHLDVRKDSTKVIDTVLSGELQKGEKLSEFISPPVPTIVSAGIQKLVHGHGFIGVPIRSENEVVGCIVFLTEESLDEIDKNDIAMMNSLADQTGIIYRNLELVQKLRRTNDELGEANEHLKQLDKAKSEFVSIASHQLRTPMTGIMGYLSMITSGDFGKVPVKLKGILEQLLDASEKMIQLINLFLDVSKIESGKLVLSRGPHKIEEIIDRSVQTLQKIASDKGLKLEFKRPKKELPILQIDDKIFDVVSNLIDNAIKYTEKGGITVSAELEDGNVKVTVKDTGRGIEPEEAKNLFNKFVRGYGIAQVNPDGSGLGLYVARRLTEAHGGRIWVESKGKGKGSSFIFTLPLNPSAEVEDAT